MPPGQAAPVFTRNRSPSPAMVPPPTSMGLPPLPLAIPEQPYNGGAKSDDTAEADMMPSEEANPIR
jgi:hypothetical protein